MFPMSLGVCQERSFYIIVMSRHECAGGSSTRCHRRMLRSHETVAFREGPTWNPMATVDGVMCFLLKTRPWKTQVPSWATSGLGCTHLGVHQGCQLPRRATALHGPAAPLHGAGESPHRGAQNPRSGDERGASRRPAQQGISAVSVFFLVFRGRVVFVCFCCLFD